MNKNIIVLISCIAILGNLAGSSFPAHAEGVIIDTGNQDIDSFVYELTEWVSDNVAGTIANIEDLSNSGIMQKIDMIGSTSLFAYYLTDYYNNHAVGAGLLEPEGSAISGVYRVEGDDTLYSASAFTLSSYNGMLINSLHYAMQIDLEAVNYNPNITYTIDQLVTSVTPIQNAFYVGGYFPVNYISNTGVRIHYNGSGLFNSSTWLQGSTSRYTINAKIEPNNAIPVITQGYSWSSSPCFCTHYGTGYFSLPDSVNPTSDSAPWDYYNDTLLPMLKTRFPDVELRDMPFQGAEYHPAVLPDPTESPTIPKTTLPVQDYIQPVTEIIEITDDSGDVVETEIAQVTETDGTPKYDVQFPSIPMLPIPDVEFPTADIPTELVDGISGIWSAIQRVLDNTGLMTILPFCLVVGLIAFVIKFLG